MRVGICGLGTVGSGSYNLITGNRDEIRRRVGRDISVAQVGCRRDHPDCDLTGVDVTRNVFDVASNPDVDIVLELIGGTTDALDLVLQAISHGKHVVTANKALIAEHGPEIFAAADDAGVQVCYEAAIAGGIPIVKAVREGLAANTIDWLAGIINGTSNYILTEMSQPGSNLGFEAVLKEAQALGYAEADPTFDVEGIDAAHKLTILSSIAFGVPLRFDAIYTEGISRITTRDIGYASELGYAVRHLGLTRRSAAGVELRVHPCLVSRQHMLAQVNGVMNAVMVGASAAGPTLYYGAGAGAGPTASSVVADVIDIVRRSGAGQVPNLGFQTQSLQDCPIVAMEDIVGSVYLRMVAADKPGVMARISSILSSHDISIEALIQKDARGGDAYVVIVTNDVLEKSVNSAMAELASLEEIRGDLVRIRIAAL
ncbi:MAG: homoserine dehydrogenase [Proteobacteria bacterium]|jgi:homoserine dehydrogenase|nr:homoserine dehydrogenase [Pseudomonadota bacterium]MDA1300624.1 homoserine dehydrogenase [Pseudomonadota bacterium]